MEAWDQCSKWCFYKKTCLLDAIVCNYFCHYCAIPVGMYLHLWISYGFRRPSFGSTGWLIVRSCLPLFLIERGTRKVGLLKISLNVMKDLHFSSKPMLWPQVFKGICIDLHYWTGVHIEGRPYTLLETSIFAPKNCGFQVWFTTCRRAKARAKERVKEQTYGVLTAGGCALVMMFGPSLNHWIMWI